MINILAAAGAIAAAVLLFLRRGRRTGGTGLPRERMDTSLDAGGFKQA